MFIKYKILMLILGTVNINFETQPIGISENGKEVYLREIWPSREEIHNVENKFVIPAMFRDVYEKIQLGSINWQSLEAPAGKLYPWDQDSTYIKHPPFFDGMTRDLPERRPIKSARVLLNMGDSITTDHISPAGAISRSSPAARYLIEHGLVPKDFNSYGARRGNDAVMARGTFANIRIVNKFIKHPGPRTIHFPSNEEMDIFDCAERYQNENVSLIILAGKEYGSGSSRDWAAKGPYMLGIKAVIAESYERIHRSNLVGMGICPLQYIDGENADVLGLTGHEIFDVLLPEKIKPHDYIQVKTNTGINFKVLVRFDTDVEIMYFENGGILNYMIRKMIA
jgi:aconitate hydratase